MNYSKRFVVEPGDKVKLHKIDPGYIDLKARLEQGEPCSKYLFAVQNRGK